MASALAGWAEQLAPWEKPEDEEELAAEALRATGVAGAVIHYATAIIKAAGAVSQRAADACAQRPPSPRFERNGSE